MRKRIVGLAVLAACVARPDGASDSAAGVTAEGSPVESASSSPWEAARRRGADFRAVGQEPGWTIDVHDGEMLRYIGDYGRDTVSGAIKAATADSSGGVAYAVKAGSRELSVIIRAAACQDVMSGESFTHTVNLRIDGHDLSGCGRRL